MQTEFVTLPTEIITSIFEHCSNLGDLNITCKSFASIVQIAFEKANSKIEIEYPPLKHAYKGLGLPAKKRFMRLVNHLHHLEATLPNNTQTNARGAFYRICSSIYCLSVSFFVKPRCLKDELSNYLSLAKRVFDLAQPVMDRDFAILTDIIEKMTNKKNYKGLSHAQKIQQITTLVLCDVLCDDLYFVCPVICQLTNLKTLNLAHNRLQCLPFSQLTSLQELNVSNNQLKQIPSEISLLKDLKRLDLHSNELTNLPEEFQKLLSLHLLNISNNHFQKLPKEIGCLTALHELNADHCKIEELPANIGLLENLQTLSLENNRLKKLPPTIGNLKSLKLFILEKNKLSKIPSEIRRLKNITLLNLKGNNLKKLPSEMLELTSLYSLVISHNNRIELTLEMCFLLNQLNLKRIYLDLDQLRRLTDEFYFHLKIDIHVESEQGERCGTLKDLKSILCI